MNLWIARDLDGDLWLYNRKPKKSLGGFIPINDDCDIMDIDNDLYPEVTYENSPQEVELKLINEIVGVAESPLKTFPEQTYLKLG